MDKYTLLIILNLPFVVFGYIRALAMYKMGSLQRLGLITRLGFWTVILLGLIFAQNLYNFLIGHNLTDTTPLSLADVMLVTGLLLTLSLCIRLYAKVDLMEKRLSDLHEKLSISQSKNN
jgi:hypothetical protein